MILYIYFINILCDYNLDINYVFSLTFQSLNLTFYFTQLLKIHFLFMCMYVGTYM